jgi:hypothetical protein
MQDGQASEVERVEAIKTMAKILHIYHSMAGHLKEMLMRGKKLPNALRYILQSVERLTTGTNEQSRGSGEKQGGHDRYCFIPNPP